MSFGNFRFSKNPPEKLTPCPAKVEIKYLRLGLSKMVTLGKVSV